MIIELKRCHHCQSRYQYIHSGGGSFDNDDRYCPECKQAIFKALADIPIKIRKKFRQIEDNDLLNELLVYKNEHTNYFENLVFYSPEFSDLDYDTIIYFTWGSNYYAACSNKDAPENYTLYELAEYDLINKKFIGRYWELDAKDDHKSWTYARGTNSFLNCLKEIKFKSK